MQFIAQLVGNNFVSPEGKESFRALIIGTKVKLRRNPQNAFDANAIEVHDEDDVMLGHINKEVAADVAPILDKRDGIVTEGHEPEYTASLYDFSNPKKPTILIEITTGWEISTDVVEEDDEDYSDDEPGED